MHTFKSSLGSRKPRVRFVWGEIAACQFIFKGGSLFERKDRGSTKDLSESRLTLVNGPARPDHMFNLLGHCVILGVYKVWA